MAKNQYQSIITNKMYLVELVILASFTKCLSIHPLISSEESRVVASDFKLLFVLLTMFIFV